MTSGGSATNFADVSGIVKNSGGALTGDLRFRTNSGDAMTERMRISSTGTININSSQYKVIHLTGASVTNATYNALNLDQNGMYEIIYTSQSYDEGDSNAGWRYVRWHAYDGSGGGGDGPGANWHIDLVEQTGTGESTHTPTWAVASNLYAQITYGNGYMSYRMLTIRLLAGGQATTL